MSSPRNQDPAALDLNQATTMPLPDSIPDSPDIVASSINDNDTDVSTETGEADDVLAPLPSDISPSVSKTDNSTTINEPIAAVTVHDDLSTQQNTTSESMDLKNISDKTSGNSEPTAPTDVLPSQKPELVAGKVDENDLARIALQQKASDETGGGSTSPENTTSTDPTKEVSVEDGDESKNGGSKTPAGDSTDIASNDTASPKDAKFVDPNDKLNNGNVIQFFFTSSTRKRPSSPVTSAPGCCNPRLHRDSDLYVKAKGEDGTVYVFEVVSAILDKASPKFEAMMFGSHKRGNREEWVWELDDNP